MTAAPGPGGGHAAPDIVEPERGLAAATPSPVPWCRATRLLVSAASAWVVFLALQLISGGRWWPWAIAGLTPPIALVIAPLLLLAAIPLIRMVRRPIPVRARRLVIGASLVSLAVGGGRGGFNPYAFAGDRPVPPGAVHVVAWNTEYWHQHDSPEDFYRYLRAYKADVYLLQEYLFWEGDNPKRIDDLARLRKEFPGYRIAVVGEEVTLSRFPVQSSKSLRTDFRVNRSWRSIFETAKVLRTDLRIGTRTVSLYNAHIPVQIDLSASPFESKFYSAMRLKTKERTAQFRTLDQDVAANRSPLLIAGDFNTTPAMNELRPLRDRTTDALRAERSIYPSSWKADGVPGALWRIDWALTRGIDVHRYDFRDPDGLSDHRLQDLWISL